ncbi:MAG: KamA family protein [Bacteroidales bacterium]|nr:KamA family protein [Bacteroidales bacterium]
MLDKINPARAGQNKHIAKFNAKNSKNKSKSVKLVNLILDENPALKTILQTADNFDIVKKELRKWVLDYLKNHPSALDYYEGNEKGRECYEKLEWKDFAAIRILDYLNNEGNEYEDKNLKGIDSLSNPFKILWYAAKKDEIAGEPAFFKDMLYLFRQFSGKNIRELPSKTQIQKWMDRHPSGLDPEIIEIRKKNKKRIIKIFIKKMDDGDILRHKFKFEPGMSFKEKYDQMLEWWDTKTFHLQFASRTPEQLNKLLGRQVDFETMDILFSAQDRGIPFFVNPHYLSLLNVNVHEKYINTDYAIKDYVFVSKSLVSEFGEIEAWEKEDIVEPGKPNAAGWLLPNSYNVHRRYPEVAILIPDTIGRACGGLCVSCQRMYDFQSGHLNFDLEDLKPQEKWWDRLPRLLQYFENDSQLRDILITGGDALMSSDKSLKRILNEVYQMAINKRKNNRLHKKGDKFAEMLRIRLGTRLPVYLPQRITDDLINILADFKDKASKIGFKQFLIQTHFETAMEITPESAEAVKKLISAGWTVTNQLVFTTAASRRGHTAKLRKVLNDIGVLTYYTFTVKGYKENSHNFATNTRAVQEQIEEKVIGEIPKDKFEEIKEFPLEAEKMIENIDSLKKECNIPFLATDRNVLNLPGVGKSLTYRTIGITYDGRRILEFDHDHTRTHSPIINKMGKVIIIESKSVSDYLEQLELMGEDIKEYESVWGYSIGETEPRMPVYEYPEYKYELMKKLTNLEI